MKPFGSWFKESAEAVRGGTVVKSADVSPVDGLLGALQEVIDASALDCGCVPCRGQCWSKDELRDQIEHMRDTARAAIKKYEGGS